jgi:YfiH family protein
MTLDIITSDLLAPARHGFFTRKGGASSGVFAGLNCGEGSSDQTEAVALNRARVAEAMNAAPSDLARMYQVHSADVITLDQVPEDRPNADGMVTKNPGIVLSVLTADCQPVLFHDAKAGVIGAAHAGWRGAIDGVLEATIDAMEAIGAERRNINAVIGPCISQRAFEVSADFAETFQDRDDANGRFFVPGTEGKYQFDLPGFGLHRLQQAGIAHAAWTGHCTYTDPNRFYSYRRKTHLKEADYGRLIATIRL